MVFNISNNPFNRRFNSLFVAHAGIIGSTCFFYLRTLAEQELKRRLNGLLEMLKTIP